MKPDRLLQGVGALLERDRDRQHLLEKLSLLADP